MSRLRFVGLVLAVAISACSNEGQGDDDPMMGTDAGSSNNTDAGSNGTDAGNTGNYVPTNGVWHYADYNVTSTNCPNLIDLDQSAGNFGITNASATGFHVIPNDGTDEFDCALASSAFNCPNRAAFEETIGNSTITGTITAQGTFSSSTRATGTQNGRVTCTGAGCAAVGLGSACDFVAAFTIAAQ